MFLIGPFFSIHKTSDLPDILAQRQVLLPNHGTVMSCLYSSVHERS